MPIRDSNMLCPLQMAALAVTLLGAAILVVPILALEGVSRLDFLEGE